MMSSTESATAPELGAAAVTETETKLATLWADLFQRELIDPHDNYFALGGNSLLAANLFARIEAHFGVKLPLASILEAPTVAELARLLESRGSHNPVVLLREGGTGLPLFLVHDADGETMLYRNLALRLKAAHPVYGLQPYSRPSQPVLHTRIEDMAAYYIGNMRRIQAHGPYLIGGLCAGGIIAVEMALQLERAGESVALVALMDAADVAAKERPLRIAKERLTRFKSTFGQGKGVSKLRRRLLVAKTVLGKVGNLSMYLARTGGQIVRDKTRVKLFRVFLNLGLPIPGFLENISVRTVYNQAKQSYRPSATLHAELLLLRAREGDGPDAPYYDRYYDPLMGWTARTTQTVQVVDVPAGHFSMLQEPHVRVVAEHIQKGIDATAARLSPASVTPKLPAGEFVEGLRNGTGRNAGTNAARAVKRPVAFILAGVGEQAAGVGRELYETEPAFRSAIDECAALLDPLLGRNIRDVMFTARESTGNRLRGGSSGILVETRVAQPAVFILGWALAQMWISWGVQPSSVLGYSVGEYVAAALAGVLRMEDALTLLAKRAEWIDEMAERGAMLAVPLPEADVLPRLGDGLWIAAVNSPLATIVGGREEAIGRLENELRGDGVATRRVVSMNGTHTPLLAPVKANLRQLAEGMQRQRPRIPMLSNVTGTWLTVADAQDPGYWGEHMCRTLRFQEGIGELLHGEEKIILEIGPGTGLGAMVRQHPLCSREQMGRVLASLPGAWSKSTEQEHVAGTLGRLRSEGAECQREPKGESLSIAGSK
jgi:thioesterase domain-containing protein/malonyl CoA-acyl carrier protein transacylase/acyl carrier protein